MKDYSQEEINKMNEIDKVEMIIADIQTAVENKNEGEINSHINQIAINIKKLMKALNHDKSLYMTVQFLNKIIMGSPTVRKEACELLHDNINSALEDLNFEKQSLIELKNYLINCKKNREYSNLPLSFGILICLLAMQNNRTEKLKLDADIWKCGISGIRYIPATEPDSQVNKYRESIEEGMSLLRKK